MRMNKFIMAVSILTMLLLVLISGCCNSCNKKPQCYHKQDVERHASVIGIEKEDIPEYRRLHANTWPKVLEQIRESNIRNYSIYLAEVKPDEYYLFSYFEYLGDDFEADMAEMAEDAVTKKWWEETDPLQKPLVTREKGEWWKEIPEVFHTE